MSADLFKKGHDIHLICEKLIEVNNVDEAINIIYNMSRSKDAYDLIDHICAKFNITIDDKNFSIYLDEVEILVKKELNDIQTINMMLLGNLRSKNDENISSLFMNIVFETKSGKKFRIILFDTPRKEFYLEEI